MHNNHTIIVVGMRANDLNLKYRVPGSKLRPCRTCEEAVVISPATLALVEREKAQVECIQCAPKDGEVIVTPEMLQEISDALGRPFTIQDAAEVIGQLRKEL